MNRILERALLALGILILAAGAMDCSKRVPVENGAFEAQQKVVLTFKDGRTIEGRIAPGNRVSYQDQGAIYQGRVASVDEDSIQVSDLVLIQRQKDLSAAVSRLADSRKRISDPQPPVTVARKDLEKVELLRFDAAKSVRKMPFWAYGSAILILLLGERS
jgi:hypothetical protein